MQSKIKKIHFVGIKGVGMTPLAIIAKEAGFEVTGCDIEEKFITDEVLEKAGIISLKGFDENHIENSDLVITTGAQGGFDNVENIKAKTLGIPVWTQGEAAGKFMSGEIFKRKFYGISVAGSHGKTTTTAMIATILKDAGLDPAFLVGTGNIPSLSSSGHFGKGNYFVAEADEYATEPNYDKTPKFLWQKPKIGVITNIEFDHPDLYSSIDKVKEAFLKFAENIEEKGVLVACLDDSNTRDLLKNYKNSSVTYGFSKEADYYIEKISIETDRMFLWVESKNASLGEFSLNVMGEHNGLNALCAMVVCLELGLSVDKIKKGLSAFNGTKRRLEFIGKTKEGAYVYDDYAHHPTEIKKTLAALKKMYPNKKIVSIFQPHTFSRTKSLFEQFVGSFSNADIVLTTDIYPSLREMPDSSVSSKLLSDSIAKVHRDTFYVANLDDVVKYVDQNGFDSNYVVVILGAGDVYKVLKDLI